MYSRSHRYILLLGASLLAVGVATFVGAQQTKQKTAKKTGEITITGCLRPANVVDRFLIRENGKDYALRSSSLNLSEHVGHSVTVKGVLKHDPKRDDYDFEGSEVNEEYGKGKIIDPLDVEVSGLKAVGASCQ